MSLFSPADIAQLQGVAALAFHDDYVITRKPSTAARDSRGNRTDATGADYDVVEAGRGRLRRDGLQPSERIIADRLGWTVSLSMDLPLDTLVTPADRIAVDGRVLHVGGVIREGALGMVVTAVCEERSH